MKKYIDRKFTNEYNWTTRIEIRHTMKDIVITQSNPKFKGKRQVVLYPPEFDFLRQAIHDYEAEGDLSLNPSPSAIEPQSRL